MVNEQIAEGKAITRVCRRDRKQLSNRDMACRAEPGSGKCDANDNKWHEESGLIFQLNSSGLETLRKGMKGAIMQVPWNYISLRLLGT